MTQEAEITAPEKSKKNFFTNALVLSKNMLIFNEHLKDLLIVKKNLKKGVGLLRCFSIEAAMEKLPDMDDYFDLSGFCGGIMFANFVYDGKEDISFCFLAGEHKEGRFLIREYQVHDDDESIEFLGEQFFDIPKWVPANGKE